MKRMYVTLALIGLIIWTGSLLAQQGSRPVDDQESDHMQKRMQLREEMHRRMMEKLLKGNGPDQDMFTDMESLLEEVMKDSFSGVSGFTNSEPSYSTEWTETSTGKTLAITPKDPKQNLDINVKNGMVTIAGKMERKTPHGISVSNFNNSFMVPPECDPTKVKMDQKDGKILVQFPYRSVKPRTPIKPSKSDVQI